MELDESVRKKIDTSNTLKTILVPIGSSLTSLLIDSLCQAFLSITGNKNEIKIVASLDLFILCIFLIPLPLISFVLAK